MLNGKTALVTGSTSGIGLAIATELSKHNASIVLNGFGPESDTLKVIDKLSKITSGDVIYCPFDISQDSGRNQLFQAIDEKFNGIDILINNAGIQHVSPIDEFPHEKWEKVISLNLSAPFYLINHFIKKMKEKNWGRIINIASTHGFVASPGKSAYVSSKHGVIGLTKVVALETAETGITCNAICPGWVKTPLVMKQVEEIAKRESVSIKEAEKILLFDKHPSGKFVLPEDIGEMSTFLCSNAANEMRGSIINIDGGWISR